MAQKAFRELILGEEYYSIEDLKYNQKIGLLLSKAEIEQFFDEKEKMIEAKDNHIKALPLKTFNSKYCFYINGAYLLDRYNQYISTYDEDFETYKSPIFGRNTDDILLSRVFSEVEGTLNVENVNTTHKRIKEIYQKSEITDRNDIIIKNMLEAMQFITNEKPAFNKENLLKLYNILSRDCLDEEDRLKGSAYYRDDTVSVGNFDGAPSSMIEECMNSLFAFVNDPESVKIHGMYLPHICHYYILYVHPYFDYNGRTARMVSFWLNVIFAIKAAPLFMSEAINDNKRAYHKAIINTRLSHNDLTYFIGYILETATQYSLLYKNLENIRSRLAKTGDSLTSTEMGHVKKILVHNPEDYFNYKSFLEYIRGTMTKSGALKILNSFVEYGILEKNINKKREAIYRINQSMITYRYSAVIKN